MVQICYCVFCIKQTLHCLFDLEAGYVALCNHNVHCDMDVLYMDFVAT